MTNCVSFPTLLQPKFHPIDKVSAKFVVLTWPVSSHLPQSDSTETEIAGISKAVSNTLKDIIINLINKKHKKEPDNKAIFTFIVTNSATNSEAEFIHNALNYMVWHNMVTNCLEL